jgi:hypothetical protein
MEETISNSNKKSGFVRLHRISLQIRAGGITRPAGFQIKAVVMPGANDFSQVIDRAFAEGFAVMRTGILYSPKIPVHIYQTNPGSSHDQKLRLPGKYPGSGFTFTRKNFYPLHRLLLVLCLFYLYLDSVQLQTYE